MNRKTYSAVVVATIALTLGGVATLAFATRPEPPPVTAAELIVEEPSSTPTSTTTVSVPAPVPTEKPKAAPTSSKPVGPTRVTEAQRAADEPPPPVSTTTVFSTPAPPLDDAHCSEWTVQGGKDPTTKPADTASCTKHSWEGAVGKPDCARWEPTHRLRCEVWSGPVSNRG